MTSADRLDFARLGKFMLRRREEYGLSQDVIAALGGPSDTKIGELETGRYASRTMRSGTLERIDRAFGWEPGGADAIIRGGEPVLVADWPYGLVSSLRNAIVHEHPGPVQVSHEDRRRILATALRLEREADDGPVTSTNTRDQDGPDPGDERSAAPERQDVDPGVDDVLDRHRQALLDQFDQMRAELRGLHRPPRDGE